MKIPIKIIFVIFLSLIVSLSFALILDLPNNLIAYNSKLGEKLLLKSANAKYFQLSMQFVTQKNQAYCGVASMVMVLNALNIPGPVDHVYDPFDPFTQDNFFIPAVQKILSSEEISKHGMTLDQATLVAQQFQVESQSIHSDDLSLNQMRTILKATLSAKDEYAIVNFFRPGLQEKGAGHFSPIAAYDIASDRFLILDVARYKYPPIWVKSVDLWNAINTLDLDSQKKRGILILRKNKVMID